VRDCEGIDSRFQMDRMPDADGVSDPSVWNPESGILRKL
jgi:hypothetical protein